jgi:hypothetical protein
MGKTTTAAPPTESRSEFDQLLDGVVPTGGMFLAPTKAHDLPLRFLGMETATSQFAIEEGNPEGVIKVLRCVRLDTNDECLLRLTSNRLLLAFQEARDTGIAFTKGTVFRVLVSGAGTKTTYRIAVSSNVDEKVDTNQATDAGELELLYEDIGDAMLTTTDDARIAVAKRARVSKRPLIDAARALKADLAIPEEATK